jgi:hypothetical protein
MEVAHVLADASPGWDIHAKSGGGAGDGDDDENDDGHVDHWVRYYDESSEQYYYYHRETGTTQWEKPEVGNGVLLLGMADGAEREYATEWGEDSGKGGTDNQSEQGPEAEGGIAAIDDTSYVEDSSSLETSDFVAREVLSGTNRRKKMTPLTLELTWADFHLIRALYFDRQVWGGQDAPVFWRIPLSGATTMEEIFTHCYNMIVAGTTGTSRDGKAVLRQNITEVRTQGKLDVHPMPTFVS